MLDNELGLAFASTEEVGRHVGVDAATVVRFSRTLGYDGYVDLRDAVRRSVPQFLTAVERVTRQLNADHDSDIVPDVFAQDMRNLEETARRNASKTIGQAVAVLDSAPRVLCIGHGISTIVAEHLAHQLALVGVSSQRASRSVPDGAIELSAVTRKDAVVVVSVWRYFAHTLSLAKAARSRGARVIALTDSKAAPVTTHANITLIAATETPELGHSVAALLTLSNALVTGVAHASPQRALERLRQIDESYDKLDVMAE